MADYRLTERASEDLFGIFRYGCEQFGERQADAYACELDHVFRLIAANPRMGRNADAVALGVRRHEHAAHVILYEVADDGIVVLAVIHRRRVVKLTF